MKTVLFIDGKLHKQHWDEYNVHARKARLLLSQFERETA